MHAAPFCCFRRNSGEAHERALIRYAPLVTNLAVHFQNRPSSRNAREPVRILANPCRATPTVHPRGTEGKRQSLRDAL